MYLLDTSVLSEVRKSTGDPNVKNWVDSRPSASLFISVVSLLEIRRGIHKVQERGDLAQAGIFMDWLQRQLLSAFDGRILGVTQDVAMRAAVLPWPNAGDFRDALIAATALKHGLAVATRNVRHFENTGASFVNPWELQP
jgi:predicted nucleic acid-binding protein